jgi:hypothetical protein
MNPALQTINETVDGSGIPSMMIVAQAYTGNCGSGKSVEFIRPVSSVPVLQVCRAMPWHNKPGRASHHLIASQFQVAPVAQWRVAQESHCVNRDLSQLLISG